MRRRWRNWRVSTKLYFLSGTLIAGMLMIGATGFNGFATITRLAEDLYADRLVPTRGLGAIMDRAWSVREQVLLHVLARDPEMKAAYEQQIGMLDGEIFALLSVYRRADMLAEDARRLEEFQAAWSEFQEARDQVLATSRSGFQ